MTGSEIRTIKFIGFLVISGIICCLIPLLLRWNIFDETSDISSTNIYSALTSNDFQISLAVGVAVSLQMILDFLFDFVLIPNKYTMKYNFLRGTLLFTLLFSDLLILNLIIPMQLYSALISLWGIRNILTSNSILYYMYRKTRSFIKFKYFGLIIFLLTATEVLQCILSYVEEKHCFMFYFYYFTLSISFLALVFIGIKVYLHVKIESSKTGHQLYHYDILGHICASIVILGGFIILSGTFGTVLTPSTTAQYLISYTYLITLLTVLLNLLQCRLSKLESDITNQRLELKRNFVRYVSHEIRTPLNTVFLGLKLLKADLINNCHSVSSRYGGGASARTFGGGSDRNGDGSNDSLETIRDIELSCEIALNTLNDLLLYEKLESGIVQLECSEIAAGPFLLHTIRPFQIQARQCGVTLDLNNIESKPEHELLYQAILFADKNRLGQVVRNLLSNALKFTPAGGTVTVSASVKSRTARHHRNSSVVSTAASVASVVVTESAIMQNRQKSYLELTVTDTGHGIAKENISKLFKGIVQFSAGKLQNGGGSGLGLWITSSIMELHHGSISAHSNGEGQGCSFTIKLPILTLSNQSGFTVTTIGGTTTWDTTTANENKSIIDEIEHEKEEVTSDRRILLNDSVDRNSHRLAATPPGNLNKNKVIPLQALINQSIVLPSPSIKLSSESKLHQIGEDLMLPSILTRLSPSGFSGRSIGRIKEIVSHSNSFNDFSISNANSSNNVLSNTLLDFHLKVLIVDDAALNRRMLRKLLTTKFKTIDEAVDGVEAVFKVKQSLTVEDQQQIDVILMDYLMPNMDGPTATRAIRGLGFTGIIIGVTGCVQQENINHFISYGANAVMMKPLDITKMELKIKSLLGNR